LRGGYTSRQCEEEDWPEVERALCDTDITVCLWHDGVQHCILVCDQSSLEEFVDILLQMYNSGRFT